MVYETFACDRKSRQCEIIVAVNFASIRDSSQLALASHRLIDRVPIKISHCSLGFITRADTMYVETDENGDTIVARAKTREELPYLNVCVNGCRCKKSDG